ncbi:MAG: hypothetical protein M5R42_01605 [Rhodocyclaceae bacterium]|nr:hypothetical protein [Rhodocyclaceae bacterium]
MRSEFGLSLVAAGWVLVDDQHPGRDDGPALRPARRCDRVGAFGCA